MGWEHLREKFWALEQDDNKDHSTISLLPSPLTPLPPLTQGPQQMSTAQFPTNGAEKPSQAKECLGLNMQNQIWTLYHTWKICCALERINTKTKLSFSGSLPKKLTSKAGANRQPSTESRHGKMGMLCAPQTARPGTTSAASVPVLGLMRSGFLHSGFGGEQAPGGVYHSQKDSTVAPKLTWKLFNL